ncbi:MAG TPA: FdtA/QdtA family cupin domain-containing protein [Cytophagaceae bacterium]|jgi:hypothetical protein|nr:FdtA/QdtA family cupin domain-containing protein [Cytophagaceae bacterium]
MQEPCLIELQKIGEEEIGYISIAQTFANVPFEIKRVYWTYNTPESVERGNHAHIASKQLLICLSGKIQISLESKSRKIYEYVLDNPNVGLLIPHFYWRVLHYTKDAIGLCLSSSEYNEKDYIRDYHTFLNYSSH